MSPDEVNPEWDEGYWASQRDEKKPYLIEWATEVDEFGSMEVWGSEAEARAEAKHHGQRLFRIEWTEVEA